VVSLIERFYDVNSGSIEYSGVDLKSLNLKWYRDQIGMKSLLIQAPLVLLPCPHNGSFDFQVLLVKNRSFLARP
jgi:hypothetical protein